jgi:hypothetical protein
VDTAWVRERIKEREGEAALNNLDSSRLITPASVAEAYRRLCQQPTRGPLSRRSVPPERTGDVMARVEFIST